MAVKLGKNDPEIKGCIDRYDQLIESRNIEGLLPFLQGEMQVKSSAFKSHILKKRQYLSAFVAFKSEKNGNALHTEWGTRGDEVQIKIVHLTTLALLDLSDTTSFNQELFMLSKYPTDPLIRAVVQWFKPTWIASAMEQALDRGQISSFDYRLLRRLESDGMLDFSPRLFALSLGSRSWFRSREEGAEILHFMTTDATVLERDLPLVFEYETALHSRWVLLEIGERQEQFYFILLERLLLEGKLDRAFFLEKSLHIQTKNWNNAIKLFFRNLIAAANPTVEELIHYQHVIFTFLHESYAQVVNYGVEKIGQIHRHPAFDLSAWLDWLPPVLMRKDVGKSVKKVLQIMDYFLDQLPERRTDMLLAAADIFTIPDLGLQEQAAKRILKYGQPSGKALIAKLQTLQEQMQGNIQQNLAAVLSIEPPNPSDYSTENTYQVQPPQYRLLEEKIAIPNDWNAVMFLISRYLSSRSTLDAELILHVFQTRQHLFPADSKAQLKPLLKQIRYLGYINIDCLMDGFLLQDTHFYQQIHDIPSINALGATDAFRHIFKHLVRLTVRKINARSALPMLCLPTHAPFWVEPAALVQRLIEYQSADQPIDWLDLTIAISRMPRENVELAIEMLPQLSPDLRPLMEFCLGTSTKMHLKKETWASKLLSYRGRADAATAQLAAWAVAARTFYPEGYFAEFEKSGLADVPAVTQPYLPFVRFVCHPRREIPAILPNRTPLMVSAYTSTEVDAPKHRFLPLQLLYSSGLFKRGGNTHYWETYSGEPFQFLYSLVPQNPVPLVWNCIQHLSGFRTLLKALLRPETPWNMPTFFAFCLAFYHEDKLLRFQAGEVLHNLIAENRLQTEHFGRQLAEFVYFDYNTLSRLVAGLGSIKDISPKHNVALFEILDSLFARFYQLTKTGQQTSLPANFKKLVEYYAHLQIKIPREASPGALECFQYLSGNATLKKLVLQIKSFQA